MEHALEAWHLDAFLLGASVVVLVLDFEEGYARLLIGAYPNLLTHFATCLMQIVHPMVVGVQIDGVIGSRRLVVEHLDIVLRSCSQKQGLKLNQRDDKLGVDAVHQFYGTHLFERDGVVSLKNVVDLPED